MLKLPTWTEFEHLFLTPEDQILNIQDFYNKYQDDIDNYGEYDMEDLLDNNNYEIQYFEIFSFWTEAKYSLLGSLSEVFSYYLGEENFECIVDWDTVEPGKVFTISYKGKTAECIESFSDDKLYVLGMMTLTALLHSFGLVLKIPKEEGGSDGFKFIFIALDVWNKGVAKFGIDTLNSKFMDFDVFYYFPHESLVRRQLMSF